MGIFNKRGKEKYIFICISVLQCFYHWVCNRPSCSGHPAVPDDSDCEHHHLQQLLQVVSRPIPPLKALIILNCSFVYKKMVATFHPSHPAPRVSKKPADQIIFQHWQENWYGFISLNIFVKHIQKLGTFFVKSLPSFFISMLLCFTELYIM